MAKRNIYKYEDYHRVNNNGELEKRCTRHKEFFPNESEWLPCTKEFFYINKKNKSDGLHPDCKRCGIAKMYIWIENNPERKKELDRKKIGTEKKKIIDRRASERQRKAGKQKKWQEENRDKVYQYNVNKKLHKTHVISKEHWKVCKEYFNNCCAYCDLPIEKHYRTYAGKPQKIDLHKEHVNHFGSNGIENCVPSCLHCNSKKWEYPFDEWYNTNNINYTQERRDKILKWINVDHKKYCK